MNAIHQHSKLSRSIVEILIFSFLYTFKILGKNCRYEVFVHRQQNIFFYLIKCQASPINEYTVCTNICWMSSFCCIDEKLVSPGCWWGWHLMRCKSWVCIRTHANKTFVQREAHISKACEYCKTSDGWKTKRGWLSKRGHFSNTNYFWYCSKKGEEVRLLTSCFQKATFLEITCVNQWDEFDKNQRERWMACEKHQKPMTNNKRIYFTSDFWTISPEIRIKI